MEKPHIVRILQSNLLELENNFKYALFHKRGWELKRSQPL